MNTHEAFHFLLTGASTAAVVLEKEAATAKAHADIIGKYSGATGSAAGNGNGTGKARKTLGMAMYELANCYRNAWGTPRDPPAARRFYTLSANLGDTDAMCEAAWCYERPFGGKKDKVRLVILFYYILVRLIDSFFHLWLTLHTSNSIQPLNTIVLL